MYTLTKHKKNGIKGFKTFVKNLELFPENTVRTMTSVGMLEDPVYMKWALKNKIRFEAFLELDYESVLKVMERLQPSTMQLLVFAIKGNKREAEFIKNNMTDKHKYEYNDAAEYTTPTPKQNHIGRTRIMEAMFDLEMNGDIPSFSWDLPPTEVLTGEHFTLTDAGIFTQNYLDGKPALEGQLVHMLREGIWKHYYPNGDLMAEGVYLQGEKSGDWTFFYPGGQIKSQGLYKNDMKHGGWSEFDPQGDELKVTYKEGRII